jgi:hypothetical protein
VDEEQTYPTVIVDGDILGSLVILITRKQVSVLNTLSAFEEKK